jgi:hypothetical protein
MMYLKKSFKKGCQIFVAHMEEEASHKVKSVGDHPILKDFEDVCENPRISTQEGYQFLY